MAAIREHEIIPGYDALLYETTNGAGDGLFHIIIDHPPHTIAIKEFTDRVKAEKSFDEFLEWLSSDSPPKKIDNIPE